MVIDEKFIGKHYPETEYEISKEKVKEFALATKADPERFNEFIPTTFPVVCGKNLLNAVLFDPELKLNLQKLVHGEQTFTYHRPIKIGETIKTSGSITDIQQKGEHDFVTCVAQNFSQAELVCESKMTFVIRGGNDKDFSVNEKLGMKLMSMMPSEKLEDIELPNEGIVTTDSNGEQSVQYFINKYMPQIYAGASGDFNAIHLDAGLGKNSGLGGYILHGMATMALGANFACDSKPYESVKSYRARFSAPVKPCDTLSFKGNFTKETNSFKFAAVNQKGKMVLQSGEILFN